MIVPVPVATVVPTRPRWRQQVEQGTKVAIGVGAGLLAGNDSRDSTLETVADATLGVAVEGQRVMLDATERLIEVGSAVARLAPMRALFAGARRMVEPVRAQGEAARVVAVTEAHTALPDYTGRATAVALDLIDLNDIMNRVDIEALLERVDVEKIIERVDVEKIIERVDIQAIIDRVDIQALMDRVDLNALMSRIDLDALVGSTDLGAIIAQSTGGIASGSIDLVRRQGVGLDEFVARMAARVRPRRLRDAPLGPPLLVDGEPPS